MEIYSLIRANIKYYYEPNPPLYINCIRPAKMFTVHIFLHSIYFNPYGGENWEICMKKVKFSFKIAVFMSYDVPLTLIQLENCSFYVLWCPPNMNSLVTPELQSKFNFKKIYIYRFFKNSFENLCFFRYSYIGFFNFQVAFSGQHSWSP